MEAAATNVGLDPAEHAEYRWCSYDDASRLVTFRVEENSHRCMSSSGRSAPRPESRPD